MLHAQNLSDDGQYSFVRDHVSSKPNIIVADGEGSDAICDLLPTKMFNIDYVSTFDDLKERFRDAPYEMILINSRLVDCDELSIIRWITAMRYSVGIVARSETDDEIDRIVLLEIGADDCVSRSCSSREITARVKAVLRRFSDQDKVRSQCSAACVQNSSSKVYTASGWRLDCAHARLYSPRDQMLPMTNKEFLILRLLMERPGVAQSRTVLKELTARADEVDNVRAVDAVISRLRAKLARVDNRTLIETVRDEGYRFIP